MNRLGLVCDELAVDRSLLDPSRATKPVVDEQPPLSVAHPRHGGETRDLAPPVGSPSRPTRDARATQHSRGVER